MVLSSNLLLPLAVGAGVLFSVVIFFYGVAQTLGAPSAVQSRLDPAKTIPVPSVVKIGSSGPRASPVA